MRGLWYNVDAFRGSGADRIWFGFGFLEMKILITGGKGMLGRTLVKALAGHELAVADLPEWDILDAEGFVSRMKAFSPDAVVHCAAMTKVDDCESQRELAYRLNETGSRNVALACRECGARLVAISTDYVFSGEAPSELWSWRETDEPAPRTVYGASKLAGEKQVLSICPNTSAVLRIAWLYGSGGPSFVHTMAKLGAQEGAPLKVVDDQRGNPTSTAVVAEEVRFLLERPDVCGVVHGTCEGVTTWYGLTCELKRLLGGRFPREIVPCTTDEFPRPAPRPRNSALENAVLKSLGHCAPGWREALAQFVAEEFPAGGERQA